MNERITKWEIEVYANEKGNKPFQEWLSQLDASLKARVLERINRVRDGNFGDHKFLQDGIYELRFHFGSGYRVYYGKIGIRIILLLTGGSKGKQNQDIKKAKTYLKNYKEEKS